MKKVTKRVLAGLGVAATTAAGAFAANRPRSRAWYELYSGAEEI